MDSCGTSLFDRLLPVFDERSNLINFVEEESGESPRTMYVKFIHNAQCLSHNNYRRTGKFREHEIFAVFAGDLDPRK